MYVTYDLEQKTRDGGRASYPKVKRVYVPGVIKDWRYGHCKKKTGKEVNGVEIEYEQSRSGYKRKGFTAHRGNTTCEVSPSKVKPASQKFKKVVPLPESAENVHFYPEAGKLPYRYANALQGVQ